MKFFEALQHHCEHEGLVRDELLDQELWHMSRVLEIAYKNKSE
jgi:hypothetical protein